MSVDLDRLETVVIARLSASKPPYDGRSIALALQRFTPRQLDPSTWQRMIEEILVRLTARQLLDETGALRDAGELDRRIGVHGTRTWAQLVERVLPSLALGITPDDSKAQARLVGRDAWAAAITARALGIWKSGPPPSLSAVCDAYVWRQLGLSGKAKRFPKEVRALFIQRALATDAAPADRLVRLYAARELGAPRPDLRSLRDALVQHWLQSPTAGERSVLPATFAVPGTPMVPTSAGSTSSHDHAPDPFTEHVCAAARSAREGMFGDRKVFISAVWMQLRDQPAWGELSLDEFKARLVRAHKRGELVLARADLVAAMDPALVAASEIRADGASFHFIVRETS